MLANLADQNKTLRGYNFQQVRNWGRRQAPGADIFRLESLFIPVNINNCHWAAAVINFQSRSITFLDSLGDPGIPHLNRLM
jgi:sentrin-specific protease 1